MYNIMGNPVHATYVSLLLLSLAFHIDVNTMAELHVSFLKKLQSLWHFNGRGRQYCSGQAPVPALQRAGTCMT